MNCGECEQISETAGPEGTVQIQPQRNASGDGDHYQGNPPAINLPGILTLTILSLAAIHAYREWVISPDFDRELLIQFAFIPARYGDAAFMAYAPWAGYWSPITYGFLHADWGHLAMNSFWMAAFGAPVARRFSKFTFLTFLAATAAGGAAMHYAIYYGQPVPVIGASAIVSGMMGAACRFAFGRGIQGESVAYLPALSLAQAFSNRQILIFILIWFAFNFIIGSGIIPIFADAGSIAWEAHIGGFLVGLLLFDFFDRGRLRQVI